jgi:hypothetical protein
MNRTAYWVLISECISIFYNILKKVGTNQEREKKERKLTIET